MYIADKLEEIRTELAPYGATLVAVSKTKPVEILAEAYAAGQRDLGENRVQEMQAKHEAMAPDVRWHQIGHLQRNKAKYISGFCHLIHSIDSLELLQEVDRQSAKAGRVQPCLLQVHIAREETKFGLSDAELEALLASPALAGLAHVQITGLMGMATQTEDAAQVRAEFAHLRGLYEQAGRAALPGNTRMEVLSMGMSGDYRLALEEGSTMVRVGSAIFK